MDKESLIKRTIISRDAKERYGDGSPESLLKAMIVRETLHSMGINPNSRFPYLEEQASHEVDTGNFLVNHQRLPDYQLAVIRHMKRVVPENQHYFYLERGIYVKDGFLYEGFGHRKIADLTEFMKEHGDEKERQTG